MKTCTLCNGSYFIGSVKKGRRIRHLLCPCAMPDDKRARAEVELLKAIFRDQMKKQRQDIKAARLEKEQNDAQGK